MTRRLGISVTSHHAVQDPREGALRMLERVRAARRAQLDSLFVGDHHGVPQPYYQNVPILGRLLAEWGPQTAGALFLLPLWHPVLVAEQVGTLAAIAEGRFVMQVGLGDGARQFGSFGVPIKQRPSRFEESLQIIRALFAGETVDHDGRYHIEGARVAPIPAEPVEVWIGASALPAIDRAARLGDGWIASPHLTDEAALEQLAIYRDHESVRGRLGKAIIRRDIYVGESSDEARATAIPVVEQGYRGFDPRALVVGSVEEVAERFDGLYRAGYQEILVRSLVPDQRAAVASLERLGEVKEMVAP